jgi:integrase
MTIKKVVSKPVKTSTKTNTSTDKPRGKKDVFEILDGQVKIYRTNSKVWQYQLWIKEEQKYVRESLQTDDKESAVNKATERFIYYRSRILKNEKVFSITSSELRDDFLIYIQNQVDNQQLSKGRQSNIKTFTKHYLKFVNEKSKIQNIPPKFFRDYLTFRRTSKSDILVSVVINESVTIKQMYRFGVDKGHINSDYCPDFGVMKKPQDEGIRDSFTIDEYGMLINISKNWYKDKSISDNEEEKYYRRLCNDFILVMANGGFRTQEVRLLKWKDIKKISETDKGVYAEVVVRAENTKIRKSRTLEMRRGDVFQRIKSYSNYTEKDDFVFSTYDKNEVISKRRLYTVFNQLRELVSTIHSDFDNTKSLYSLRHFWITIRILAGLNVYDIAKISGTSLVQIQKHYDAATSLITSKKMNKNSLRFDEHGDVVIDVD